MPGDDWRLQISNGSPKFKVWLEMQKGKNYPRVFYRGTNTDDERRIKTGSSFWDSLLFAADNIQSAKAYGNNIEEITAKPEARILYEGTREFRSVAKGIPHRISLLDYCTEVARRALEQGYDAVWYQRQTDVGTAILNHSMFISRPLTINM